MGFPRFLHSRSWLGLLLVQLLLFMGPSHVEYPYLNTLAHQTWTTPKPFARQGLQKRHEWIVELDVGRNPKRPLTPKPETLNPNEPFPRQVLRRHAIQRLLTQADPVSREKGHTWLTGFIFGSVVRFSGFLSTILVEPAYELYDSIVIPNLYS